MSWPLSVQKVLQAERFSAGRLHHVAQDSRSVTPTTGLAGKKEYLAYLSSLISTLQYLWIIRIRMTETVSKCVWPCHATAYQDPTTYMQVLFPFGRRLGQANQSSSITTIWSLIQDA